MEDSHSLGLIELPSSQKLEICSISDNELSPKLTEMGLFTGRQIQILFRAPLGDPIAIDIDGTVLSLRLEEASLIKVKCIELGQ